MAPIPSTDHCITYDNQTAGYYAEYGPLFAALQAKRYNLAAHAVRIKSGPVPTSALANSFVLPNGTLIYPVALSNTSSVTLLLRAVPANVRAWQASFPGEQAGMWTALPSAQRDAQGVWQVTVPFDGTRASQAALVRSTT